MQITHCPQCETAFKVSPQQLALAKGWVRCGRCAHVFEAHLYFESSVPIPVKESLVTPAVSATELPAPELFRTGVTQSSSVIPDETNPDQSGKATTTFLNIATLVGTGLLSFVFLFQLLIWNRNSLVAEEPGLQPLLSMLCQPSDCKIDWPYEPDAVLIENSSFMENPEGGYNVQLRLKNTQHHAVAMPALELSLTDLRDQVLVRRVFLAKELSDKDHLQALRDVRANLNFDLDETVKTRITGFRAIIFYP